MLTISNTIYTDLEELSNQTIESNLSPSNWKGYKVRSIHRRYDYIHLETQKSSWKNYFIFFITQNNFLMLVYNFFGRDYCYINLNIASLFNCQL